MIDLKDIVSARKEHFFQSGDGEFNTTYSFESKTKEFKLMAFRCYLSAEGFAGLGGYVERGMLSIVIKGADVPVLKEFAFSFDSVFNSLVYVEFPDYENFVFKNVDEFQVHFRGVLADSGTETTNIRFETEMYYQPLRY